MTSCEFEVDGIIEHRRNRNDLEFYVKWKLGDYSWEPFENLRNCQKLDAYIKEKFSNCLDLVEKYDEKTSRKIFSSDKRLFILSRQKFNCELCHKPISNSSYQIDHIIPLNKGGSNNDINLQALCYECHIFKTANLDNNLIPLIIQTTDKLTPQERRYKILKECQFVYFNRFGINFNEKGMYEAFSNMSRIFMIEFDRKINEKIEIEKEKLLKKLSEYKNKIIPKNYKENILIKSIIKKRKINKLIEK